MAGYDRSTYVRMGCTAVKLVKWISIAIRTARPKPSFRWSPDCEVKELMYRVKKGIVGVESSKRELISKRYKRITKAVNSEFWGSGSETAHSLYVGSYGRGTATTDSDLDVLLSLPRSEYERFDTCKGNGQSRLLQAVKTAVSGTYSTTDVKADGQVVVVRFSDGMKFELLPAFERVDGWGSFAGYEYPDTHMGGRWLATDPKAEQEAMKEKNRSSKGLLFDTCKHIRNVHVQSFSSYRLSGIVIDSFVFSAIDGWHWSDGESSEPAGTYEARLLDEYYRHSVQGMAPLSLFSPGSQQIIDTTKSYECLGKVLRQMAC